MENSENRSVLCGRFAIMPSFYRVPSVRKLDSSFCSPSTSWEQTSLIWFYFTLKDHSYGHYRFIVLPHQLLHWYLSAATLFTALTPHLEHIYWIHEFTCKLWQLGWISHVLPTFMWFCGMYEFTLHDLSPDSLIFPFSLFFILLLLTSTLVHFCPNSTWR